MKKTATAIMCKSLLTVFIFLLTQFRPAAQLVTNYSFGSSTGTFTALAGGVTTTWTGNTDDAISALIPIGFDFWYMGTRYTTLSASTNGWFSFNAVPTDNAYTNNLSSGGTNRPVIAPLWDDLDIVANSNVTYTTTGTAGSRVFTLQYINAKWNYQAFSSGISFQVKLYETSGKIEFIYRPESGILNSASASIGITATATGSGSFLSVNNAGTAVSSTTENSVIAKPVSGKIYSFSPPVPAAPGSLSFTAVNNSGMTLNWTDLSGNERGFVIYRSTDGVNYSFVSQVAANTTSSVQGGLSGGTNYYWRVYAITEGGLSTALSGNRATSCIIPAAPVVTSPLNYCLNATASQLTATGTNLVWGSTFSGTAGGSSELTTPTYMEDPYNNKKTNFTTNTANVTITSVDYYIPAWMNASGLVLGIFNGSGTLIATSSTNTTQTASSSPLLIRNVFNFTIATPGNYSIGLVSGIANIGSDSPSFPITEPTGTLTVTGVSVSGTRCFNNIQFTYGSSSTVAPIPSTSVAGSTQYQVTQTVNGCTSAPATITVNVNSANISQIPAANLIAEYLFTGNANDATGTNNGTLQNSPVLTTDRFNIANQAYAFDGSTQYIATAKAYVNPTDFSISIWFKTASTTGGRLIGFGRERTGSSGQYDRHLYMNNAGQVYFGIYPGVVMTVNSELAYNDNNWHLATATVSSSAGMTLYVDGQKVAANAAGTSGENYTGYWKIGYDNLSGWTSQPSNFYFNGKLDDALIYDRAISAGEAAILYTSANGAGNNGPVCSGAAVVLSATTVVGATYSWTGPNGFSSSLQNPTFTYSPAAAGIYTLTITKSGCSGVAYTNLVSASVSGQWTGSVSTDWANAANWCSGVVPNSSTNVVIPSTAVRMPAIAGSVSCRDLLIATGASLSINGSGILNIAGTLTNSGTLTNNGTTNFNGSSGQQTFSGVSSFYNLTVSNTSGLLLPALITVNNNLTLSAGILDANNFTIVVLGNWINNASAAGFSGGSASVRFTGAATQEISGTFATTFNNLVVAGTGTVLLKSNIGINGNLTVSQGTLDLSTYTANRTSAGGILTVSNNALLRIGGTNTYPVNYATSTLVVASTVEYSGTNQAVGQQAYGNLKLSSASGASVKTFPSSSFTILGNLISVTGNGTAVSFTAASDINVNGGVSIGAGTTFNGGNYTHTIGGNWVNDGSFNGNGSTIVFAGAAASVGGSGNQLFNHLTIAAPQVSFSNTAISMSGNLATTGSGSFSQASGGTLIMSGTGSTISGSGILLDNLTISGSVTTSASFEIKGNFNISGSFSSGAGDITMSGISKTITGAGSKTFYKLLVPGSVTTATDFTISSSLNVNGSFSATAGSASFTGSSTLSGTANLYTVNINGTYLQLTSNSALGIANTLSLTAGSLDVTSFTPNTVDFNGAGNQLVNAITYYNLTFSNGGNKTAAGGIIVKNDIRIMSGTTFTGGSFTHALYRDWFNFGSFTAGAGNIEILGNATANIWGATTFNILTINTTAEAEMILQSNISAATVDMISGRLLTKDKTLTISVTRTGNGIILGNIHRSHSFVAGVDYAFEGPYNTVRFSSVSGVTDVTVTAEIPAAGLIEYGYAVNRIYTISVPAGTYDATLRLHYEDNELNGNDEAAISLFKNEGADWNNIGKTGNSTVNNYVEHSGLTNISFTWALSSVVNHVRWNGSVSSDWHTAANWTVIAGVPSRPPSGNDLVDLGTDVFVNQPVISGNASAKNIHFGSAKAVDLSLVSGGSLVVSGNVDGDWSGTAVHSINAGNQNLTINGNLVLSDGADNQFIDLHINAGTVNVTGSLVQDRGAGIYFTGSGNLKITGDFHNENGVFQAGSGTVEYYGAANQHLAHVTYNNVIISKTTGIVESDSTATILGNLVVTSGEMTNSHPVKISGNVSIATGAILNNTDTIHIGGNWSNSGSFNDNGSVIFDGEGAQSISASTFNNLTIDKPVGSVATLMGDIQIRGDASAISGTYDVQEFNNSRVVAGGSLFVGDSATIILGGNNPPINFANFSISKFSTIIFDGNIPQVIAGAEIAFGNVVLRNAGQKIIGSSLTILGNLTIESGATVDAGDNTITLNGNWTDNGTFVPGGSTVVCAGTSKTISGNTTFNKLTATGSYTILNDVTFNGLLNITSTGSLTGGNTIHTTLHGDLINSGVLYTLGTTTYSGNVVQTLSLINAITTVAITVNFNGSVSPVLNSTSAPQFGFLNINNTGGVNPSVGWTVLYSLNIGSGASFNGGVSTHNIVGSLTNNGTITSNGTINFIPTTAVNVNLGTGFSSTGSVVWGGTGAITLTGTPVSFRNVVVSNTHISGITPSSNWNIGNNLTINSGARLNAGSYSFQVGGNITIAGILNSGSSSFLLNGSGTQEINTASPFYNVAVNKAAGFVSLLSNVTVTGNLNFVTGKIQTGGKMLALESGATLTGAAQNTGWVIGNLRKHIPTGSHEYMFEVGDTSNYTPCKATLNNVTTAGMLTVFTLSYDHPQIGSSVINASKSVNRYWSLANEGIVCTSYDATFNFVETDLDPASVTSAMIAARYNSGSWIYPTLGTVTSTSVQALGLTVFAEFQIGEMILLVKTWDGGAGTRNWSDAANWNSDGVPTATDDVELKRADTINIDVPAVTKNLLINNPNLILTINDGRSLSVSGDFTLTAGVFNTAAGFPSVTGTVDVSGGTVGFTGTVAQTIPALNYNNLLSSSTGARTLSTDGVIGISGSFSPGTNSYTVNGSTVSFNGNGVQSIAGFGYDHLVLSNAGEKIFSSGITKIGGTFSITGDATANAIMHSSTISYNGTSIQLATPINYYNLDADNAAGLMLNDLVIFNKLSISSGSALIGTDNSSRTITLNGDLTVASGAVLTANPASNTTHQLLINGSISNNGTIAFRPDANSLCNTTFSGTGSQQIEGAGTTTDFNQIIVDMGALNTNHVDMTAAHFTAPDGFLTLKNGSFNLDNAGVTVTPFSADINSGNTLIPATAGLWVNAGSIHSVDMNWTVAGLVKVTGGVLNMGNAADNVVTPMSSANFSVSGGSLVLASRIGNAGSAWTVLMKGGEMIVNTSGSTAAGIAPFSMDAQATFDMSGGTITIQNKGGIAGEDLGYKNNSITGAGFSGGSLQMGNSTSGASQIMKIISQRPVHNLVVNSDDVQAHLTTSNLAVANDVTVSNGSLDISNHILSIGGQISNSGSFIAGEGTIKMNGTAAQTIPAGAFTGNVVKHLTIDNTAGVSLNGTLDIAGILLPASGQFHTGGHLTLLSTAAETALIDGSGTGEVLDNVTMQRYLESGFGYKYFSSPFQASTVNGFGDDLDLAATFPSFYRYEEDLPSSGWINYTNASGILHPFSGYAANFGNAAAAKTVDLTGVVNNNTVEAPMLYNHNRPYTKGFHLVGNPYPSPINWDAAGGWNKTNIDNAVYYYTNSTTDQYAGVYTSYVNGISSDGIAGNIISSMQGFFVHVTDGSFPAPAQLSINNTARTNDLAPVFHSSSTHVLRLSAGFSDSVQMSDAAVIYLDNHGRNTFDRRYDALKLMNTNPAVPSLYAVSADSAKISIRAMAYPNDSVVTQPLGLRTERDGWITFTTLDLPAITGYPFIYLFDARTNIYQDLKQHPAYRLFLKAGDHEGRFFIVFRKEEATAGAAGTDIFTASFASGKLVIKPSLSSSDKGTVAVSNMAGQLLYKHELNGNASHTVQREFAGGIYLVTVYSGKGTCSKKIFIGK